MKDYYDILQVSPSAEPEVIEAAYKRLARKYHPDVDRDPAATERMRDLNEAYEVLSDPSRRAEYDAALRGARARPRSAGPERERTAPPPPPPPPSSTSTTPMGRSRGEVGRTRHRLGPILAGVAVTTFLFLVAGAGTGAAILTIGRNGPNESASLPATPTAAGLTLDESSALAAVKAQAPEVCLPRSDEVWIATSGDDPDYFGIEPGHWEVSVLCRGGNSYLHNWDVWQEAGSIRVLLLETETPLAEFDPRFYDWQITMQCNAYTPCAPGEKVEISLRNKWGVPRGCTYCTTEDFWVTAKVTAPDGTTTRSAFGIPGSDPGQALYPDDFEGALPTVPGTYHVTYWIQGKRVLTYAFDVALE